MLAAKGPLTIPSLLESTRSGLTSILGALQALHQFRLVEYTGEDEYRVHLTASGGRTAAIENKHHVQRSAGALLG